MYLFAYLFLMNKMICDRKFTTNTRLVLRPNREWLSHRGPRGCNASPPCKFFTEKQDFLTIHHVCYVFGLHNHYCYLVPLKGTNKIVWQAKEVVISQLKKIIAFLEWIAELEVPIQKHSSTCIETCINSCIHNRNKDTSEASYWINLFYPLIDDLLLEI